MINEAEAGYNFLWGSSQPLVSAAPTTSSASQDVFTLVLSKLNAIRGQLVSMDERIRKNETALSDRTTERAASTLVNPTPEPSVAKKKFDSSSDTVIPSSDF